MPKKDSTGKVLIVRKDAQTSFMKILALRIPNLSLAKARFTIIQTTFTSLSLFKIKVILSFQLFLETYLNQLVLM